MNIPTVIVEWGLGLVSVVGLSGFAHLQGRASHNEDVISMLKSKFDGKLCKQDVEHKTLLKELLSQVVFVRNCDDKQDLWQAKFDSIMEANQLQHGQIISTMIASNKVFENQLKDVLHKLDELEQCVRKIQLKQEC